MMTEKVVKLNEKLAAKGKVLDDVSREEFDDVAQSVGLHPAPNRSAIKQDRCGRSAVGTSRL